MLKVGDSYAQSFTATDQIIKDIAKVSGDINTVKATVTETMPKGIYLLFMVCQDQNQRKTLTGTSKVKWGNAT